MGVPSDHNFPFITMPVSIPEAIRFKWNGTVIYRTVGGEWNVVEWIKYENITCKWKKKRNKTNKKKKKKEKNKNNYKKQFDVLIFLFIFEKNAKNTQQSTTLTY